MDFLKKNIFKIFIPLLLDIVFIFLVSPFLTFDNLVPSIKKEGSFLIYFYVILFDFLFLIAFIVRRELFKVRLIVSNLLFICLIIFNFIYKDNSIFELSLFVFITYDIVFNIFTLFDSLLHLNKEPILPPNRFTQTRKHLSRFISSLGFIVAFLEMILLFYFVETSLFIWVLAVALSMFTVLLFSTISLSINYSPLAKLNKNFNKSRDYNSYLAELDDINTSRLHKETINLLNIIRFQIFILFEFPSSSKYLDICFIPKTYDNISKYYLTLFLYYLKKEDFEFLNLNKQVFLKKTRSKDRKKINDLYDILEDKKVKRPFYIKKQKNYLDEVIADLYLNLKYEV